MKKRRFWLTSSLVFSLCNLVNSQAVREELSNQSYTGNWYEKLHWWKKAKPQYEEITKEIGYVEKKRKELIEKRSSFYPEFQKLLTDLGINKDTVEKKITELIEKYNLLIEEEESVVFEDEQKDKLEHLKEIRKILEELKRDFQFFFELKNSLDEAILDVLVELFQNIDSYQKKALDSFEVIEFTIDDKKARELYETIENANENIKSINNYIDSSLRQFINEIIAKSKEVFRDIRNSVEKLNQYKIYIGKEPAQVKELDKVAEEKKKPIELSFWQKLLNSIYYFFKKIWSIIKIPFEYLFKKTSNVNCLTCF